MRLRLRSGHLYDADQVRKTACQHVDWPHSLTASPFDRRCWLEAGELLVCEHFSLGLRTYLTMESRLHMAQRSGPSASFRLQLKSQYNVEFH